MKFAKIQKAAEKEGEKLHQARLTRCIPIAREIQDLVAHRTLPLGDDVQTSQEYNDCAIEVLQLLLDRNVHWTDREFIFQLALQPLSFVKEIVTNSLTNSWTSTLTGLFGKSINELTMEDVDKALRKAPEEEVMHVAETKKEE